MKKKYCGEQTYDENLAWEDTAYEDSAEVALSEVDEDAFSYADEEHIDEDDIPEEPAGAGKGKRKKSAERIALEARFLALYGEFMRPTQEYSERQIKYQADDLYGMLYELNRGWAYRKAKSYRLAGFSAAEGEFALAAGCEFLPCLLMEDRAAGKYCDYPTQDGTQEPIISVADLQGLKKGWTHTDVYFTSGSTHYVSAMPDISQYQFITNYKKKIPMPVRVFPAPPIYNSASMQRDAKAIRYAYEAKQDGRKLNPRDEHLASMYENLFKGK